MPIGAFQASVNDLTRQLSAETPGTVTSGSTTTADLQLASSSVTLAATKYDANNFPFDVQPDGSLGIGDDFQGAFTLDVTVGGSSQRFDGTGSAHANQSGRQIFVQQTIGAVEVTRKVFVPRDGYFARYLEVIRNPTASPVIVGARISNNVTSNDFLPNGVIETASGGSVLNTSATSSDRWILFDADTDEYSTAFGFVFDGPGATVHASSASRVPGAPAQISYEWSNITAPAGGSVALLHFSVRQHNRSSARLSASHLMSLPPEALAGFTAADVASVANFVIPPGTASFLAPLPPINGSISGRVWDYSHTYPAANAQVEFKSRSGFFPRSHPVTADSLGRYTLTPELNDSGSSIAIPVGPFDLYTSVGTNFIQDPGTFPAGQSTLAHDVLFTNSGNLVVSQAFPTTPLFPIAPSLSIRGLSI